MYKLGNLSFEWDEDKNEKNQKKHGLSFERACEIFLDVFILTEIDERFPYEETREISIGSIAELGLVIIVAHTDRNGNVRIISARKANKKERMRYEIQV